ncbi:hypothetical protein BJ912DRAFT_931475 [Pholiota molesta]|nr:hypothetical protein BJ912DRAFT_931475 [Pholiota molesta]
MMREASKAVEDQRELSERQVTGPAGTSDPGPFICAAFPNIEPQNTCRVQGEAEKQEVRDWESRHTCKVFGTLRKVIGRRENREIFVRSIAAYAAKSPSEEVKEAQKQSSVNLATACSLSFFRFTSAIICSHDTDVGALEVGNNRGCYPFVVGTILVMAHHHMFITIFRRFGSEIPHISPLWDMRMLGDLLEARRIASLNTLEGRRLLLPETELWVDKRHSVVYQQATKSGQSQINKH